MMNVSIVNDTLLHDKNTMETNSSVPREMKFSDDSLVSIIAYSILFIISSIGNLTVFITLCRNRHRKTRVNLFMLHLCIADLIVTFMMIPMEVGWHLTVAWKAGDVGCRMLMFFRTFGFYLSSFVLIAISLDRYLAIAQPLSLNDAGKRGKLMLLFSWLFSSIASAPQSVIFHVESHPQYPWFTQCVTFNFFPSASHELAYNLFNIITLYVLPLMVVMVSYGLILWEFSKSTGRNRPLSNGGSKQYSKVGTWRRSGNGKIERARSRTLKMTVVIVAVFVLCWTPYFVISIWWWIDKTSASNINPKIQRGLFIFAVSNSCMNPFVYGFFAMKIMTELRRCCCYYSKTKMYRAQNAVIASARMKQFSERDIMTFNDPTLQSTAVTSATCPPLRLNERHPMVFRKTTVSAAAAAMSSTMQHPCSESRLKLVHMMRLDTLHEMPSTSTEQKEVPPHTPPHISNNKSTGIEEESFVVIT